MFSDLPWLAVWYRFGLMRVWFALRAGWVWCCFGWCRCGSGVLV